MESIVLHLLGLFSYVHIIFCDCAWTYFVIVDGNVSFIAYQFLNVNVIFCLVKIVGCSPILLRISLILCILLFHWH